VAYLADGKPDLAATYRAIAAMDEEFEKWGWKSPRDFGYIEKIASLLRDPGFILVTRDILESALSGLTYQNMPIELGLYEGAAVYQSITGSLRLLPWPTLVVSYSEALQHPQPLVELICSFLSIRPEAPIREHAASFIQPGKHAYRLFDADPDDPPVLIAEEDLRMDAELLAVEVGKRYGAEYLQRFDILMADTRTTADKLCSKLVAPEKTGLSSELSGQLCRLLMSLPQDDFPNAHSQCDALKAARYDPASNRLLVTLKDLLDTLASAAHRAKDKLDCRASETGLTDFKRVYYILQVLIRVRELLRRGSHLVKFQSAPPDT
jgi:hypothetical protein